MRLIVSEGGENIMKIISILMSSLGDMIMMTGVHDVNVDSFFLLSLRFA